MLETSTWSTLSLWLAVAASGLYHGVNPAMGWPLAVSAALMEKSRGALARALGLIAGGHLAAVLALLLPFVLLAPLLAWQHEIRILASLLLIGYGGMLLARPRHPRALARIPPRRLALWSFAVAIAHGAALMLLPLYLGLCGATGHEAAASLIGASAGMAIAVSLAHTAAMVAASATAAWLTYRYVGLQFVSRSWFNLDTLWASSLMIVGGIALAASMMS